MTSTCISRKVDKANFESGEDKPRKKQVKKDECAEPKLILEDNKYILTKAAADLMGVKPDDKLEIKYEQQGKNRVPVIASDEVWKTHSGNRLTKSLTVACRGSKHDELVKFGTEFDVVPHDKKEGLFILKNKDTEITEEIEDLTDVEEKLELPIDIDLQDLIDDSDDVMEVPSSMFQL
jgi:hypothetical protein